jgi:hypothetical protein
MTTTPSPLRPSRRRLQFAVTAILVSAAIAALLATGVAEPSPNLKVAYFVCVAMGVLGLIQLVVALTSGPQSDSLERPRE